MSCSHFEERLALYAGGDLERAEAAEVESHLVECATCRIFLHEIQQSMALLDGEPVDSAAIDAVRERTLLALQVRRFISCSELEERLALYAGGDLEAAEVPLVESHLRDCAACGTFLHEIQQSMALLDGEALDSAAIDAVRERTLSALRPAPLHLWRYAAAVCLMLGGLSWWAWPTALPGPPMVSAAVPAPNLPPAPMPLLVQAKRVRKAVEKHESVVVKLQTSDPNVVIYWITD